MNIGHIDSEDMKTSDMKNERTESDKDPIKRRPGLRRFLLPFSIALAVVLVTFAASAGVV